MSGLAKTFLQGTVQGGRRRGRQKRRWEDNSREWTGLTLNDALRKAENRRVEEDGGQSSIGAPMINTITGEVKVGMVTAIPVDLSSWMDLSM